MPDLVRRIYDVGMPSEFFFLFFFFFFSPIDGLTVERLKDHGPLESFGVMVQLRIGKSKDLRVGISYSGWSSNKNSLHIDPSMSTPRAIGPT